jgi:hypothetical protein
MAETYANGGSRSGTTRVAGDKDNAGNFVSRGSLTGQGAGPQDGVDLGASMAASLATLAGAVSAGKVTVSWGAALPVSVASLPLPANAAVETGGNLAAILAKLNGSLAVTGTFWQATQPVSVASLPLPSGAATAAKQDSLLTALGTPFQVGGAIGNTAFGATQSGAWSVSITGSVTLGAGSATVGKVDQGAAGASAWKVDGSAVTQPISVASLPLPSGAATLAGQQATPQAATGADGSTSITTGGTAQNLFSGATPTNGFEVCNPDASNDLWISDTTTAVANGQGSIRVAANGGSYTTPPGYRPIGAVSVVGASTGQKITARRW